MVNSTHMACFSISVSLQTGPLISAWNFCLFIVLSPHLKEQMSPHTTSCQ